MHAVSYTLKLKMLHTVPSYYFYVLNAARFKVCRVNNYELTKRFQCHSRRHENHCYKTLQLHEGIKTQLL